MILPRKIADSISCQVKVLSEAPHANENKNPIPSIDWEHLHQLSDGSSEFELELLQLYVDDSWQHFTCLKQTVAALQQACENHLNRFWEAEQAAHHLRGASANVGALEVQRAADLLEHQFRQHTLEGVPNLLASLEDGLIQMRTFLSSACNDSATCH